MFQALELPKTVVMSKLSAANSSVASNFSFLIATEFAAISEVSQGADPEYEQFLADVWVGIVLTLMVLSCVCCMCSCLLYHKFQQWKRSVIEARQASEMESGYSPDLDTLPSYTVASGLPSYEEALEQLKQVKELVKNPQKSVEGCSSATQPRMTVNKLSVTDLFQFYRTNNSTPSVSSKT